MKLLLITLLSLCVVNGFFLLKNNRNLIKEVNDSNDELTRVTLALMDFESRLAIQEERVSVLKDSVNPKDRTWNIVKRIRKAVQDSIVLTGSSNILNISQITEISSLIYEYSEQYDVPVSLIVAVMRQESAFVPSAVSRAGASGLMQLMPETAAECARSLGKPTYNIFRPRDNIQFGVWYLAKMTDIFHGDIELAIRAYNVGPTYVKKVLAGEQGFADYPRETVKYHEAVMAWKKQYETLDL